MPIRGSRCEPLPHPRGRFDCSANASRSVYHLSVKPISRSAGRTATAAAAYRSGERIVDERTGETHDYTRKRDVVHREILVPAGSPAWAEDRQTLWNAAEVAEKRKDARVARDHEVAIPKELTYAQGVELVRDFSQDLVDRHGVAVDFAIHKDDPKTWDGTEKGWQGYHAHILSTTRVLGREGFGEKADPELSNAKRQAKGLCSGPDEIAEVRYRWEVLANKHLELAGQEKRIDARSLKEQGIDREPTIHLGPGVTGLERRGIPSQLGDLNREILGGRTQVEQIRVGELGNSHARAEPTRQYVDVPLEAPPAAAQGKDDQVDGSQAVAALVEARHARLQRLMAKSERREERRERTQRELEKASPSTFKGTLAGWQEKAGQQAQAALEKARKAAVRLVEQARKLTQRLREASSIRRLVAWSEAALRRRQQGQVVPEAPGDAPERPDADVPWEPRLPAEEQARLSEVDKAKSLAPRLALERTPPSGNGRTEGGGTLKDQVAEGVAAFRARFAESRAKEATAEPSESQRVLDELHRKVDAELERRGNQRAQEKQTQEHTLHRDRPRDHDLGR
jgi:hypothetical protein